MACLKLFCQSVTGQLHDKQVYASKLKVYVISALAVKFALYRFGGDHETSALWYSTVIAANTAIMLQKVITYMCGVPHILVLPVQGPDLAQ